MLPEGEMGFNKSTKIKGTEILKCPLKCDCFNCKTVNQTLNARKWFRFIHPKSIGIK